MSCHVGAGIWTLDLWKKSVPLSADPSLQCLQWIFLYCPAVVSLQFAFHSNLCELLHLEIHTGENSSTSPEDYIHLRGEMVIILFICWQTLLPIKAEAHIFHMCLSKRLPPASLQLRGDCLVAGYSKEGSRNTLLPFHSSWHWGDTEVSIRTRPSWRWSLTVKSSVLEARVSCERKALVVLQLTRPPVVTMVMGTRQDAPYLIYHKPTLQLFKYFF